MGRGVGYPFWSHVHLLKLMVRHLQFPCRDEEGRRTYCTSFSPSEYSTCCVPKVDLALKRLSHDVYPCANEYRQTNKHLRARDYHVDHQDVRVLVGHNWTPRPNDCKSKGGNYSRWHNCSPSTGNLWNRGEKYLTRKCFCAKENCHRAACKLRKICEHGWTPRSSLARTSTHFPVGGLTPRKISQMGRGA